MRVGLVWSAAKHATQLYRAETSRKPVSSRWRGVLLRWVRFNSVGIAGFVVQLATLWILSRGLGIHYLLATPLAVEIAVLHNFLWHAKVTFPTLSAEHRL